jgi:hypothetical protein
MFESLLLSSISGIDEIGAASTKSSNPSSSSLSSFF